MDKTSGSLSFRSVQTGGGFFAKQRRPVLVYLVSFFLPVLIMGVLWAINKVQPFGSRMILAHDQWHQYYPFYLDLRSRLLNGNSLFHTWTTGMGSSYLPLFAYYLASPLNLVAVLLPAKSIMLWYNAAVLIRMGLAGAFFAFFLRKTFDRSELTIPVFSTMYALCSFIMGYYWNSIWLDTIALLPLVVVGAVSLLRDGRYTLYTFSLFLSLFCSYYIGFFICIFVLLVFILWHIVNWDDLGSFGLRLLRFAVFTLLAVGMTALLTVPTYLSLQSTANSKNEFPEPEALNMVQSDSVSCQTFAEHISGEKCDELFDFFGRQTPEFAEGRTLSTTWSGFHDAMLALRLGEYRHGLKALAFPLQGFRYILSNTADGVEPTSMDGYPNVACGFCTLIFALLFLFCRKIPLKERIAAVALLFFFGCSFIFRTLDFIWHGFHFPNQLPYRFSFLWSFVLIYMAYRAYTELDSLRWWRVALMMLPLGGLLYLILKNSGNALVVLIPTLAASILLCALLILFSVRVVRKGLLLWVLCILMVGEASLGAVKGVNKVGTTDSAYYPLKAASANPLIEQMQAREKNTADLWRAEFTTKYTLNESTLFGFNGVGVFSSAANSSVSTFLQSIGLAASARGNRYSYQEADPFTNLLLGVKYLIDRNGRFVDKTYFEEVGRAGSVLLLQNRAYVPLGFAVNEKALNFTAKADTLPYMQLNTLFREMSGEEAPLYTVLPVRSVAASGTAKLTHQTSSSLYGECSSPSEENCIEVTYEIPNDCYLCFYSRGSNNKDVSVVINGTRRYSFNDKYGCNRTMGNFQKGDTLTLRYMGSNSKSYSATFAAAAFDTALFDAAREKFAKQTMIATLITDTRIEGAIRMEEAGLVYTSIPYDNGWTLKLDGKSSGITPVGGAMIAFRLAPGMHTIELSYEAPGFTLGLTVSIICFILFLVFLLFALLARFNRPPVVKVKFSLEDPDADRAAPEDGEAPEPTLPEGEAQRLTSMPPLDMTQTWTPPERGAAFPGAPIGDDYALPNPIRDPDAFAQTDPFAPDPDAQTDAPEADPEAPALPETAEAIFARAAQTEAEQRAQAAEEDELNRRVEQLIALDKFGDAMAEPEAEPEAAPEAAEEPAPEALPEAAPETAQEAAPEAAEEAAPGDVPETEPESLPEIASEDVPESEPEDVP